MIQGSPWPGSEVIGQLENPLDCSTPGPQTIPLDPGRAGRRYDLAGPHRSISRHSTPARGMHRSRAKQRASFPAADSMRLPNRPERLVRPLCIRPGRSALGARNSAAVLRDVAVAKPRHRNSVHSGFEEARPPIFECSLTTISSLVKLVDVNFYCVSDSPIPLVVTGRYSWQCWNVFKHRPNAART